LKVPPIQQVPIPKEVQYNISFSSSYHSSSMFLSAFSTAVTIKNAIAAIDYKKIFIKSFPSSLLRCNPYKKKLIFLPHKIKM
jgi:hypothetical protein